MASKPTAPAKPGEPRIVSGAATMVGTNLTGNEEGAAQLERRMRDAIKRAQDKGLDDAEQAKAVRVAIERYRKGEPEE